MTFEEIRSAIVDLSAADQKKIILEIVPQLWPKACVDDACVNKNRQTQLPLNPPNRRDKPAKRHRPVGKTAAADKTAHGALTLQTNAQIKKFLRRQHGMHGFEHFACAMLAAQRARPAGHGNRGETVRRRLETLAVIVGEAGSVKPDLPLHRSKDARVQKLQKLRRSKLLFQ